MTDTATPAQGNGKMASEPSTPMKNIDTQTDLVRTPPNFKSSLSYTTVRDYAYPPTHKLHYGPPPAPSAQATPQTAGNSGVFPSSILGWWNHPQSTHGRRSSDPSGGDNQGVAGMSFRDPRAGNNLPPPLKFADGPPWFEDEDLASPVVISNRHRKHKSSIPSLASRGSRDGGVAGDGSKGERGRMLSITETAPGNASIMAKLANGTIEEATMPAEQLGEPGGTYVPTTGEYFDENGEDEEEYEEGSEDEFEEDDSRYSKDYHFSIASPDEEMHGKAVALFDFTRENDNELGLLEGQVIWVSYRHGQGWLVAEDPKTGESGLVPEEYVRLFREINDHPNSIDENTALSPASLASPIDNFRSPTSPIHSAAIQSHFSTSSRDLEKYPHTSNLHHVAQRPPPMDRSQSQKSDNQMDVDSPPAIDREHFTMQQRKLDVGNGKVLNGKEKGEQEEYQSLHHKSPSLSGAVTPSKVEEDGVGAVESVKGALATEAR